MVEKVTNIEITYERGKIRVQIKKNERKSGIWGDRSAKKENTVRDGKERLRGAITGARIAVGGGTAHSG